MPIEGPFGLSSLQSLVLDGSWHPVTIRSEGNQQVEVINWGDRRLLEIEAAYPSKGVAEFVLVCWQELMRFNASGGYCVPIPWNHEHQRELTPAEVIGGLIAEQRGRKRQLRRQSVA